MSTDTITLTASEALGFVTVTCAVSLQGDYTYDLVLHENESHSGNARGLTYAEARLYLSMLLDQLAYAHLVREIDVVLARLTRSVGGT